jgi:hypothetical protein
LQYILEQVCDLLDVDYDHYEGCEWSEVYNDNLDGKTISFDVIEKELLPRLYKK